MPCRVVHLDLKSSNVLIAGDGSAKISDVGLAALMSQDYLSQMAPAGTWSWLAPEVILGGEGSICMHTASVPRAASMPGPVHDTDGPEVTQGCAPHGPWMCSWHADLARAPKCPAVKD